MNVIAQCRALYQAWMTQQLFNGIVSDGLFDTNPHLWRWMMEKLEKTKDYELPTDERHNRFYTATLPTIDDYLVYVMRATRVILENDSVETAVPQLEPQWIRLEEYLTDNYGRPLPLAITQQQFLKTCIAFLDALAQTHDIKKRAYYLRHYDWLIEEGQRWVEYWAFPTK
jgi:hypothetical protein